MKIFVLTTELSDRNGWGRYSKDLLDSLTDMEIEASIATSNEANNTIKVDAQILPAEQRMKRNYFFAPWFALRLLYQARQCDIIHAFVEPYSHVAYWLSVFSKKPYFVTAHGTYATLPLSQGGAISELHRKSLLRAQKVICVSSHTEKELHDNGIKNTVVINNGIDAKKFSSSEIAPLSERNNQIISVGAIEERKGQHVVVDAMQELVKEFPSLVYTVVGNNDKEYFHSLKKKVSDYNLNNNVDFIGQVSDEELIELYKKSKILVMTSINKSGHFEGFGLVYIEANAFGTPVIGSKNTGAEDAIKNGETGILVEQENSKELASAIRSLFNEKEKWSVMSSKGVSWAQEHDWSIVAKLYIHTYKTIYEKTIRFT